MISRVRILLVSFELTDHEITRGQSSSYSLTVVKFINNINAETVTLSVERSDLALLLQDLEVQWLHTAPDAAVLSVKCNMAGDVHANFTIAFSFGSDNIIHIVLRKIKFYVVSYYNSIYIYDMRCSN
jgi:hypothetical protein